MRIEGKTKIVTPLWGESWVGLVETKDDITAGDGAMHDVMKGKAGLATRTTCNVFEYLRANCIPVAYIGRDGPTTFLTKICTMIPVEVVARRVAVGSYIKRNPEVSVGTVFAEPVVEFFYKTTGRRIGEQELPCDDPLMIWNDVEDWYDLFLPNRPEAEGYIGRLDLTSEQTIALQHQLLICGLLASEINDHLHDAWEEVGGVLYDFKVEFGVLSDEEIVLADVVDCDSWRVIWNNLQLSKQGYRDGEGLDRVLGIYRLAASLTDQWV